MSIVFFSYSHADDALRDQLEKQLAMLKRQGVIETWHDRRIDAGEEIDAVISDNLEQADIILLLVSADFLASDYCYDREMMRAMERHEAKDAVVIPVILRPCDWHGAPFGKLNATPPDGKPVTQAPDRDQAILEVARAIRKAAERFAYSKSTTVKEYRAAPIGAEAAPVAARSSNLRLAKTFTERDKDKFKFETFEFIAKFFENSLDELAKRNAGVEGMFRQVDANRFTAAVYVNGKTRTRCTVFVGGNRGFIDGIAYSSEETSASNSYNEMLSVKSDDQKMFLTGSLGHYLGGTDQKLSQEGAAEFYWERFIEPLQREH